MAMLAWQRLLAIGGCHFLLTAGHVVNEAFKGDVQRDHIYVPNLSDGALVPVVGESRVNERAGSTALSYRLARE
jgi:hypothetical protein